MTLTEAYELLDLLIDTDLQQVRQRFSEQYSEYRMLIDNAPTPNLRKKNEQNLALREEAFTLITGGNLDDTGDLPSVSRWEAMEELNGISNNPKKHELSLSEALGKLGLAVATRPTEVEKVFLHQKFEIESELANARIEKVKQAYQEELNSLLEIWSVISPWIKQKKEEQDEIQKKVENELEIARKRKLEQEQEIIRLQEQKEATEKAKQEALQAQQELERKAQEIREQNELLKINEEQLKRQAEQAFSQENGLNQIRNNRIELSKKESIVVPVLESINNEATIHQTPDKVVIKKDLLVSEPKVSEQKEAGSAPVRSYSKFISILILASVALGISVFLLIRNNTDVLDTEPSKLIISKNTVGAVSVKGNDAFVQGMDAYRQYKLAESFEKFKVAAKENHPESYYFLGRHYAMGEHVKEDYEKAFNYYKRGVEAGDMKAHLGLGFMYWEGLGVKKDKKQSDYHFKQARQAVETAAAEGNYFWESRLGVAYTNQLMGYPKDLEKAFLYNSKSANKGYCFAQNNLGVTYKIGTGVKKNYQEALKLFKKSAQQGYGLAQLNLGSMYTFGEGIPKDSAKGFYWYSKAANQGIVDAEINLASMYYMGDGVTKDLNKAADLYKKAAAKENSDAQTQLGYMYSVGEGVSQDMIIAANFYRKASELGNEYAQANLGDCYYYGIGVEKNIGNAFEWWQKAARQGNKIAKSRLEEHNK
jgi:TPR repeat protein